MGNVLTTYDRVKETERKKDIAERATAIYHLMDITHSFDYLHKIRDDSRDKAALSFLGFSVSIASMVASMRIRNHLPLSQSVPAIVLGYLSYHLFQVKLETEEIERQLRLKDEEFLAKYKLGEEESLP